MKILLITGSYPPDFCGIGDYSYQLVNALKSENVNISILTGVDWELKNYFKLYKQIKMADADIIHIQYPTVGFKYSIVPQLLSLSFKHTVVTIHEVSQAHIVRKISLFPFSLRSALIFTNKFEQSYYAKLFFGINKTNVVIPIGSNIIKEHDVSIRDKDPSKIVHFGLIRPLKGIEEVILLGKMLKESGSAYSIIIAGQLLERYESYYKGLKDASFGLPIEWKLNLEDSELSELMAGHMSTYLPYPDGASARRTTMNAAIINHMLIFTTKGKQTTADIEDISVIVSSHTQMFNYLSSHKPVDLIEVGLSKINRYKEYIKSIEWDTIAKKHVSYYNKILGK